MKEPSSENQNELSKYEQKNEKQWQIEQICSQIAIRLMELSDEYLMDENANFSFELERCERSSEETIRLYDQACRQVCRSSIAVRESVNPYLPKLTENLERAYDQMNKLSRFASAEYEKVEKLRCIHEVGKAFLSHTDNNQGAWQALAIGIEYGLLDEHFFVLVSELFNQEFSEEDRYFARSSDWTRGKEASKISFRKKFAYTPIFRAQEIASTLVWIYSDRFEEHEQWPDFTSHARKVNQASRFWGNDSQQLLNSCENLLSTGEIIGIDFKELEITISMLLHAPEIT